MTPRGVAASCLLLVALLLVTAPGVHAKGVDAAHALAMDYLETQGRDAGDFAPHWAEAAAANGFDVAAWPPSSPLARQIAVPDANASFIQLLRPLHALALANDVRAIELRDRVLAGFTDGQFGPVTTWDGNTRTALNDDAYAILALVEAGVPADDVRLLASAQFLRDHQNGDGGWGWAVGATSSLDMTGMVLRALHLVADGLPDQAEGFLDAARDGNGFAERPSGPANCESTAWGIRIQALLGRPRDAAAWDFLLALQQPDGGFAHLPGGISDPLCSMEAITLLGEGRAGVVALPETARGTPALGPSVLVGLLVLCGGAARGRFRDN